MLLNPIYAVNAKKASQQFRDQKELPLDRAVWWIEWAMRNPNANHFQHMGSNLTFIELYSLDVVILMTVIVLFVLKFFKNGILKLFVNTEMKKENRKKTN